MNSDVSTLAGAIVGELARAPSVGLGGSADLSNVLFIGAAVFGALLLGGAGYVLVRRVRAWSQREEPTAAFTLQDLREMRSSGQISHSEYEAMRKAIIAGVAAEASASDAGPEGSTADATDANSDTDSGGSDGGEPGGDERADNGPDATR